MQKMPLTINGVDFSALTERLGYSITYEDRKGSNGAIMQNCCCSSPSFAVCRQG